jgi:hypothetical protein
MTALLSCLGDGLAVAYTGHEAFSPREAWTTEMTPQGTLIAHFTPSRHERRMHESQQTPVPQFFAQSFSLCMAESSD